MPTPRAGRRACRGPVNDLASSASVIRLEGCLTLAAWAFALAGAVLAWMLAEKSMEYRLDHHRTGQHAISAVLVRDAPVRSLGGQVPAPARWKAPDGTHTGIAQVRAGAKAGTRTTVWINARGALARKLITGADAALQEALAGLAAAGVVAAVAVGACGVHRQLNRRRMEQWSREWEQLDTPRGRNAGS